MSISIHVASLFIYAAPRFSFLLYCLLSFMLYLHKFMLHQHNKFMLYQDFITPYSEKLSSPAVAWGPTYPKGFEITRYNNS